jgi:hypothetical protein
MSECRLVLFQAMDAMQDNEDAVGVVHAQLLDVFPGERPVFILGLGAEFDPQG